MSEILSKIHGIGIVPVIALDDASLAADLAKALCAGGLPVAEVTYRTDCAHEVIATMKKTCPQMLVGAGTVLTKKQVDSAIDAGAEFIVSPGLNPNIVQYCQSKHIPIIPGTANASDIETALSLGLTTVKFFPAEQLGGIKMIQALAAPYSNITFMPTGGVNAKNINDYLSNPKVIACGGTWMIDKVALKERDFEKIENLTKEAVNTMLQIHIKHIGINCMDAEARSTAHQFARLFQGDVKETSKGFFGSNFIEIMNESAHTGTHGHIAMGVNSTDRAISYFKSLGYEFDESTIAKDNNGYAKFAYFKDEIGGFRIHLVNN